MRPWSQILSVAFYLLSLVSAAAQGVGPETRPRPIAGPAQWELLGEQQVGFRTDRDIIDINQPEEWFRTRSYRRLRVDVERADLDLQSIQLVYLNGHTEVVRIDRTIAQGGQLTVDLPGERSFLKSIVMSYRSRLGVSIGQGGLKVRQAVVRIHGERAPRRTASPPPLPMGWSELETIRFDRRTDRVEFRNTLDDGMLGQLRMRALDDRVVVRRVLVRFRNGEQQSIETAATLQPGQMTDPIDLDGRRRVVASITVLLEPRVRPGQSALQVLGTRRPARDQPAAQWREIDRQTIDLTADSVVLRSSRGQGRFSRIMLRSEGEGLRLRSARIEFRNGEIQVAQLADRLQPGQQSRPIDLDGDRRAIERVTVLLEPRRRSGFATLVLVGLEPEPGPAGPTSIGSDWVELGRQSVGFRVDRDEIRIGRPDEWYRNRAFRRLYLAAQSNDLHLMSVRIVYLNGFAETYNVDRMLRAGTVMPLDLRGDRSYLRSVEMTYRARPGFGGQAVVTLYGEPAGRRAR